MVNRHVVKIAAWLEIVVGVIFVTAPNILCLLVFDAKPDAVGRPLARWVGVVLLGLGIACLPSRTGEAHRTAVLGLGFQPVNLSAQFYGNAVHPVSGSPWSMQLQLAFLFPKLSNAEQKMMLQKRLKQLEEQDKSQAK